ncbi:SIR2 family protein [Mesorhizobium sp.]|uniref:SIR2 family NAD-dependent protein deacylase n=1 Tax=Mesorhizobium sp. TaxID=1871066 RepID=UPI000FE3BF01|nr:SIR2 family protein [Mesorhizobium sp.]RWQ12711.1 MAG: hypothetical protein EOR92_32925 [Mesorhizobium sp.]
MAFDPTLIPRQLIHDYRKGRCGLLVGAGASAAAKLPLWGQFLKMMTEEAVANAGISERKAADYTALIEGGRYLTAASGLKEDLGSLFAGFVKRVFVQSGVVPTPLHEAMPALNNLQFVITTNYDTLIERAYRETEPDVTVCTFKDAGEVRRSLSSREFFILKAHGDAMRSGEGIILTEQDYRQILFREPAYQHMLATMFSMYSIIFVGASMTDPELNLMLNYLADTFSPDSGPTHYAALTKEKVNEVEKERWYRDFKIRVIPVSSADEYKELPQFLRALAAA